MWHRLKNLFFSFRVYNDLSPDLRVRQQVNRALRDRPTLKQDEWFESFYKSQGIAYPIAIFAYTYLEQYSGLKLGSILPTDRLEAELQWTAVCWFDWQQNLCKDFYRCFEIDIDIENGLALSKLDTVGDLIVFLNCHWHPPTGTPTGR
ncbi:MAG: hypothetical protein HC772_08420 [Leptolyngbyaceae cyanobacterium CRU_2_3]|nr:hypothetical protein [Leptolyngbyaceae cyanobacterium CRU_2_3]